MDQLINRQKLRDEAAARHAQIAGRAQPQRASIMSRLGQPAGAGQGVGTSSLFAATDTKASHGLDATTGGQGFGTSASGQGLRAAPGHLGSGAGAGAGPSSQIFGPVPGTQAFGAGGSAQGFGAARGGQAFGAIGDWGFGSGAIGQNSGAPDVGHSSGAADSGQGFGAGGSRTSEALVSESGQGAPLVFGGAGGVSASIGTQRGSIGSQPTPGPATDAPEQGEESTRQTSRIAFGLGTTKGKLPSPAHAAFANLEQGGCNCPRAHSLGRLLPSNHLQV